MKTKSIILASGSPRRKELLTQAGFTFEVMTSNADESYDPALPPKHIAPLLAQIKANAVFDEVEDTSGLIFIGADTIVALGNKIYGKPIDEDDACRMLAELSGRTHQVITGVYVRSEDREVSFAEITDVAFRELSEAEITAYVATGEPMDKAGAYGIQGLGGRLVDHIVGDFDNVVGLPVGRLAPILRQML